ncbi:sterol-binding protein [Aliigemmobacter aestuarii]|uniref:Sterol-binding protein n=1 Tax=Aliigemmobacter aestuarii TaxID=1445661 RepID=A0A4S3ML89_9RHOB|nr:SCP2 sterol-binding domain-containing protein [Gemmobacter aestuarii]THD82340.1 sterol-binding protein [Gemmobacter aestuarii]
MPADLPVLPGLLGLALRPLPLFPLNRVLAALTRRMVAEHPVILRRLGDHADRRFLIDVTDLPHVFLLHPASAGLTARRRHDLPPHDVRLTGTLAAFLAMMHGAEDGDALFFSRDLAVEGDTSAVLALRNAMDDAELDLSEELAALAGPFGAPVRRVVARAERISGLALHRMDGTEDLA